MACFVGTKREILVLKCHMSWLDQQTTSQTQALLPAQQCSIFKQLLLMAPLNKKLLAADANLRQTHTHTHTHTHIFLVKLPQFVCMCDVPWPRQHYASSKTGFCWHSRCMYGLVWCAQNKAKYTSSQKRESITHRRYRVFWKGVETEMRLASRHSPASNVCHYWCGEPGACGRSCTFCARLELCFVLQLFLCPDQDVDSGRLGYAQRNMLLACWHRKALLFKSKSTLMLSWAAFTVINPKSKPYTSINRHACIGLHDKW